MSAHSYAPFLDRIRREQSLIPTLILHYDTHSRDLGVWFWPVTPTGVRVTPTDLFDYRTTHDFKTPCCLCACIGGSYIESAIYRALDGLYAGEYVTACASGSCGYMVCIERMYTRRGLLVEKYPVRVSRAGPVIDPSAIGCMCRGAGPARPTFAGSPTIANGTARLPTSIISSIPTYSRPAKTPRIVSGQLATLDSSTMPGLSQTEFRRLFAQCPCGLIMTRRVFRLHSCAATVIPEIIDLTSDAGVQSENTTSIPIIIDLTGDSDDE